MNSNNHSTAYKVEDLPSDIVPPGFELSKVLEQDIPQEANPGDIDTTELAPNLERDAPTQDDTENMGISSDLQREKEAFDDKSVLGDSVEAATAVDMAKTTSDEQETPNIAVTTDVLADFQSQQDSEVAVEELHTSDESNKEIKAEHLDMADTEPILESTTTDAGIPSPDTQKEPADDQSMPASVTEEVMTPELTKIDAVDTSREIVGSSSDDIPALEAHENPPSTAEDAEPDGPKDIESHALPSAEIPPMDDSNSTAMMPTFMVDDVKPSNTPLDDAMSDQQPAVNADNTADDDVTNSKDLAAIPADPAEAPVAIHTGDTHTEVAQEEAENAAVVEDSMKEEVPAIEEQPNHTLPVISDKGISEPAAPHEIEEPRMVSGDEGEKQDAHEDDAHVEATATQVQDLMPAETEEKPVESVEPIAADEVLPITTIRAGTASPEELAATPEEVSEEVIDHAEDQGLKTTEPNASAPLDTNVATPVEEDIKEQSDEKASIESPLEAEPSIDGVVETQTPGFLPNSEPEEQAHAIVPKTVEETPVEHAAELPTEEQAEIADTVGGETREESDVDNQPQEQGTAEEHASSIPEEPTVAVMEPGEDESPESTLQVALEPSGEATPEAVETFESTDTAEVNTIDQHDESTESVPLAEEVVSNEPVVLDDIQHDSTAAEPVVEGDKEDDDKPNDEISAPVAETTMEETELEKPSEESPAALIEGSEEATLDVGEDPKPNIASPIVGEPATETNAIPEPEAEFATDESNLRGLDTIEASQDAPGPHIDTSAAGLEEPHTSEPKLATDIPISVPALQEVKASEDSAEPETLRAVDAATVMEEHEVAAPLASDEVAALVEQSHDAELADGKLLFEFFIQQPLENCALTIHAEPVQANEVTQNEPTTAVDTPMEKAAEVGLAEVSKTNEEEVVATKTPAVTEIHEIDVAQSEEPEQEDSARETKESAAGSVPEETIAADDSSPVADTTTDSPVQAGVDSSSTEPEVLARSIRDIIDDPIPEAQAEAAEDLTKELTPEPTVDTATSALGNEVHGEQIDEALPLVSEEPSAETSFIVPEHQNAPEKAKDGLDQLEESAGDSVDVSQAVVSENGQSAAAGKSAPEINTDKSFGEEDEFVFVNASEVPAKEAIGDSVVAEEAIKDVEDVGSVKDEKAAVSTGEDTPIFFVPLWCSVLVAGIAFVILWLYHMSRL